MAGLLGSSGSGSDGDIGGADTQQPGKQPRRRRLALVFGREVEGLMASEIDACTATLSIPIGRLQGEHAGRAGIAAQARALPLSGTHRPPACATQSRCR